MNDDLSPDNAMDPVRALATEIVSDLTRMGMMIAMAESCTGGLIAAALTDIAGSSAVVDRGFVTYSNAAKVDMLGVSHDMIQQQGAVSEAVASAMAQGALARSGADIAIAVTGIAGPGGGSDIKPVGLVWFACAAEGQATLATSHVFDDEGRDSIRYNATLFALHMALGVARDLHDSRQAEADRP